MFRKFLLLIVSAIGLGAAASGQQVAVKTNLLYWATTTPNIGIEVAVSDHSTLGVSANYNPWVIGVDGKIQHWFVQPEYRYWFSGKFNRGFLAAHVIAGKYTVGGFKLPYNILPSFWTHYYKGWAAGFGVGYGYQWYLGNHWNLEASIAVGYARTKYYRTDNPSVKVSHNYLGPTQVGISFVYLFNSKKL